MSLIPVLIISASVLVGAAPPPEVALGVAAYERGDFTTARAILKPMVYDASADQNTLPYAWAAAYLAQMSRRGEGTTPDWPLSCALFNYVWGYAHQRGPGSIPQIPFVDDGIKEVCLADLQEVNALRTACFLDGVTRQEFVLEAGAWIVVDRLGFHLGVIPKP